MRKILFLFFSLSIILILSCRDKKGLPADILPQDKMRDILWDMISASQYLNLYVLPKDSVDKLAASAKVYGRVFQVYKISKDQFDKSYSYYREHDVLLEPILDSLSKRQAYSIERLQKRDDTLRNPKPFFREK
ncbi:MAG: DUF4296 domain-containing protein [Bacteroidetes bacterium]|jgi:hypothetical protein|nr:MAG: DUF4296 domain-containing protein [Bacteroidota bacterium]